MLTVKRDKEVLLEKTVNLAHSIRDVASIMVKFGVNDPRIGKAVQLADVGQTALASALSGNYLGAVAAVSSMLGGSQSDPDEQRFEAIMARLDVIDRKLNRIVELQKQTLEAIHLLSQQVADMDRRLNERLDRVDFQLDMLTKLAQQEMWREFLSCNTAWQARLRFHNGQPSFDDDMLAFSSFDARLQYSQNNNVLVSDCYINLKNYLNSVISQGVFGNLFSIKAAIRIDPAIFQVVPIDPARSSQRAELDRFLNKIFIPTGFILRSEWPLEDAALPNLLAFLTSPSANVNELDRRSAILEEAGATNEPYTACRSEKTLLGERLLSMLCDPPSADGEQLSHTRTIDFLSDPMLHGQLEPLGDWVAIAALHSDLLLSSGKPIVSISQIEDLVYTYPPGRELLSHYLFLLDVAIAQQAMVYGDWTAETIYRLAWNTNENRPKSLALVASDSDAAKLAVGLLINTSNHWLRANVMMIALDRAVKPALRNRSVWNAYAFAMRNLESHKWEVSAEADSKKLAITRDLLSSIFTFPAETELVTIKEGDLRLFTLNWADIWFTLPTPEHFRSRTLVYPSQLHQLIRLRKVFTEKTLDYDLLQGVSEEARLRISSILWEGLGYE